MGRNNSLKRPRINNRIFNSTDMLPALAGIDENNRGPARGGERIVRLILPKKYWTYNASTDT